LLLAHLPQRQLLQLLLLQQLLLPLLLLQLLLLKKQLLQRKPRKLLPRRPRKLLPRHLLHNNQPFGLIKKARFCGLFFLFSHPNRACVKIQT
jgi:hypothetical protein